MAVKCLLIKATNLSYPDPKCKISITTDASQYAVGGVLEQWKNGHWQPLGWWSKHLQPSQTLWSTYRRELFGVKEAIQHFHEEIKGREDLIVYTDHLPIVQAIKQRKLPENDQVAI